MSLGKSFLANYLSQFYVAIVGFVVVPLYVRYMGSEAYGLVGFYAMLQAWFMLLDAGLSTTLARETARFRGEASKASEYGALVRVLERLFAIVAVTGGTSILLCSEFFSRQWLRAAALPQEAIELSIELMAIAIAARWMSGLYRGVITGFERFVWLGWFNAVVATVRFIGVIPALIFVSATPAVFFGFQVAVAIFELLGLFAYAKRLIPTLPGDTASPLQWSRLRSLWQFSLTIAFTTASWIFITQTDKLVLSIVLPLAQYGQFVLAVLVAGGVIMIGVPISSAVLVRLTKLEAAGDSERFIKLYRGATQLVALLAGAAATTAASCSEYLLWAWTGDEVIARDAAPILSLYAIGNGVLVVSSFPYYLQYAKGDLRLHFLGNLGFLLIMIPSIVWAGATYGGLGAGWVWLGLNIATFILWLPWVHRKFVRGLNYKWYGEDVLPIFAALALTGLLAVSLVPRVDNRLFQFLVISGIGLLAVTAGAIASSEARSRLVRWQAARAK